jgi:hypothetical protein
MDGYTLFMYKKALLIASCLILPLAEAARFGSSTISDVAATFATTSPDGRHVFVVTEAGELMRSPDGGRNFAALRGFGSGFIGAISAKSVACSQDGETIYVTTGAGQILKAVDGGRNGLRSFGALKGTGSRYIGDIAASSVSCNLDGGVLYVVARNGKLFQSADGGGAFRAL